MVLVDTGCSGHHWELEQISHLPDTWGTGRLLSADCQRQLLLVKSRASCLGNTFTSQSLLAIIWLKRGYKGIPRKAEDKQQWDLMVGPTPRCDFARALPMGSSWGSFSFEIISPFSCFSSFFMKITYQINCSLHFPIPASRKTDLR